MIYLDLVDGRQAEVSRSSRRRSLPSPVLAGLSPSQKRSQEWPSAGKVVSTRRPGALVFTAFALLLSVASTPTLATVRQLHRQSSFTPCEQRMIQNVNLLDRVWADRAERHFRRADARSDRAYEIKFYTLCDGPAINRLDPNCTRVRHTIERLGELWLGHLRPHLAVEVRAVESRDVKKSWRAVDYGVDLDFIEPGRPHEDAVGGYVCNFGRFTLAHSLHSLLHVNMLKDFTLDEREQHARLYLPAVLSHELGHVLGLGHSNEVGSVLTAQFAGVLAPTVRDRSHLTHVFAGAVRAYDELVERERAAERKRQRLERDRQTVERDRTRMDEDQARLDRDRARLDGDRERLERDGEQGAERGQGQDRERDQARDFNDIARGDPVTTETNDTDGGADSSPPSQLPAALPADFDERVLAVLRSRERDREPRLLARLVAAVFRRALELMRPFAAASAQDDV